MTVDEYFDSLVIEGVKLATWDKLEHEDRKKETEGLNGLFAKMIEPKPKRPHFEPTGSSTYAMEKLLDEIREMKNIW